MKRFYKIIAGALAFLLALSFMGAYEPAVKAEADPCVNEETSKEGRRAANTGDAIKVDVENRKRIL